MSHFFYDTIIQRHLCRNINSCMSCFSLMPFSFKQITKPTLNWSELVLTTARCHWWWWWWWPLAGATVRKAGRARSATWGSMNARLSSALSSLPLSLPALPTSLKMISNDYRLWGLFFILTHLMIRCQTAVARVIALQVGNFDNCFSWRWSQCEKMIKI